MDEETKIYLNKRIAYTALLLQEYAYREILDSPLIKGASRHLIRTKIKYVQNQLIQLNKSSKATREQVAQGDDVVLDNVSIMASVAATLAIVPNSQVDYIEEEFTKVCLEAIERDTNGV